MIGSFKERINIALSAAGIFLLLVDILFLWSAVLHWVTPPEFGWSLPQRIRSIVLIFLVLSTVLLTALVLRKPDGKNRKAVFVALLGITTFVLGAFAVTYEPIKQTWLTTEELAELGLTESYYSAFPTCEQVKIFVEFGYERIDWDHDLVLIPEWMDQNLRNNPKLGLADCIEQEIRSQVVWLKGDNQARERATKKIYALYLEADFLDVLWDSSSLMAMEKSLICQKKMDSMGRLSIQYYMAEHHDVPEYNYLSDTGLRKLQSEICQP